MRAVREECEKSVRAVRAVNELYLIFRDSFGVTLGSDMPSP